MRTLVLPWFAAAVLPLAHAQEEAKLDLKVLFAGVPGHARTAAWRDFLTKHTAGVTIVDVKQLQDGDGADADVVVLDCPDPIVRNADNQPGGIEVPRPKGLTLAFGRPTVVVGGMAMVTDDLHIKSNWL